MPDLQVSNAVIQPDDLIELRVLSAINPEAANRIAPVTDNTVPTYLVDIEGFIDLPLAGRVKIAGLTRDQAKEKLAAEIAKFVREPAVHVRFVNFRFTVLGEVKNPGNFNISTEKVSILEALGYAGDFSEFARKNSVRVIRDSSGKREIGMINLTQQTVFTSPYYYLRRNDVVFVEALPGKTNFQSISRTSNIIAIASGVIALGLTIVNISK